MHPTLLSLGNFAISSFGFLLSLGFLLAMFLVWRLSRVYDLDEERTLDLSLLTFFGGLIGSRILFVLFNLSQFNSIQKIVLLNKYPGLSFWGGMLFGSITLYLLSRRFKINFFSVADFVIVGVFAALVLGEFGCLLGSCQYGEVTKLPIGVFQEGLIGNRFPIQILSALVYLIICLNLWRSALRFHWSGKVLSSGIILLGIFSALLDFLRGDRILSFTQLSINQLFGLACTLAGIGVFYLKSKRSFIYDLKLIPKVFTSDKTRSTILSRVVKGWYNLKVNLTVGVPRNFRNLSSRSKSILRGINVKYQKPKF